MLNALCISSGGGIQFGSELHKSILARIAVIGAEGEDFDSLMAKCMVMFMSYIDLLGVTGNPHHVHMAAERLPAIFELVEAIFENGVRAATVAPSRDLRVTVLTVTCWFGGLAHPALCKVPGWKQLHGADGKGALLREICETYDFEADHSTFKSMFGCVDFFMQGAAHLGLLLGWGDFPTVRKGFVKVVAGYQAVAERVRKGESDWADYVYETWMSRCFLVAAPGGCCGRVRSHSRSPCPSLR